MSGPQKHPDIQVDDHLGRATALESTEGIRRHSAMRIKARCDCGVIFMANPYDLWSDRREPACSACANGSRGGVRKPVTPIGTEIGFFKVEAHEFITGTSGSRAYHRYTLRDSRCGHVIVRETPSADIRAQIKEGLRVMCGCPAPYITNGYIVWRWAMPDGRRVGVQEHRIVMERELSRELLPNENVHHINGARDDNRRENLELWSTSQPSGQRVADKLAWAREIVALYSDLPEAVA